MHLNTFDIETAKPASPNIKTIDKNEMLVIASMDCVGKKHDIVLACARCRRPFQGFNTQIDKTVGIECGCRELRADNTKQIVEA